MDGMEMRRGSYAVVFVMLTCALVMGASEGVRRGKDTFFANGGGLVSPEIDEEMAEQAWIHCRKELMDGKEAIEKCNLYIPREATADSEVELLENSSMHQAILLLPPHVKQTLINCLRWKGIKLRDSGQRESSNNWFISCLEWFLGLPKTPRRYLASNLQTPAEPPSPSPSPAPNQAPGPSAFLAPGPAAVLTQGPPVKLVRNQGTSLSPTKQTHATTHAGPNPPPKDPKAKKEKSPPPPLPKKKNPQPKAASSKKAKPPPKENDGLVKIIAIAGTAALTLIILALLCVFCIKKRRSRKVGHGPKDDRPLLTLSAGSSQKSTSLENSSNSKEFSANAKLANNMSMRAENESLPGEETTSEAIAGGTIPTLKPPPGRQAPPPPEPPGPPPPPPPRPRAPPPPKVAPPPKPMPGNMRPPLGHRKGNSGGSDDVDIETGSQKTKLKPFFWDKVNANADQSMVWHEISAGSFQFNEEQIETLFGYNATEKAKNDRRQEAGALDPAIQYIQIIDRKKAQNLSILLKALNVSTEEVSDALREGNELPVELLRTLLKMAPNSEEELKLRLFTGDFAQLSPADRFLKTMVDIPFAYKRIESLIFLCSLPEEVSTTKESLITLEVACNKLKKSRLFLKLLEAVLKTGNRMNDGTYRGGAQAFRLDTLLKLADVKGTDGKTTLLHFVVQEIIRSEGRRASRTARASRSISNVSTEDIAEDLSEESEEHFCTLGLEVVSGLSNELEDVRKAAVVDGDGLTSTVATLGQSLIKTRDFVNDELKNLDEDSDFVRTFSSFLERAETDIKWLLEEEKRITSLVKSTADYFHGNAGREEGIRLFVIVRDFLVILNKICTQVRNAAAMKPSKPAVKKEIPTEAATPENRKDRPTEATPESTRQPPVQDMRQRLFPAIAERRVEDGFSSDEET